MKNIILSVLICSIVSIAAQAQNDKVKESIEHYIQLGDSLSKLENNGEMPDEYIRKQ
jgi:hypothetical protein